MTEMTLSGNQPLNQCNTLYKNKENITPSSQLQSVIRPANNDTPPSLDKVASNRRIYHSNYYQQRNAKRKAALNSGDTQPIGLENLTCSPTLPRSMSNSTMHNNEFVAGSSSFASCVTRQHFVGNEGMCLFCFQYCLILYT